MQFLASTFLGAFIIALAAFLRRGSDHMTDYTLATFFASYPLLLAMMTAMTGFFHPRTIDLLLYNVDRGLGLEPFTLIALVAREHWLNIFLFLVYVSLPLLIALAWVLERSEAMLRAAVIAPIAAFFFYNLFPAVGPIYALHQGASQVVVPWDRIADLPRNCFPSMHFS
jgi:PAP2 superfamily